MIFQTSFLLLTREFRRTFLTDACTDIIIPTSTPFVIQGKGLEVCVSKSISRFFKPFPSTASCHHSDIFFSLQTHLHSADRCSGDGPSAVPIGHNWAGTSGDKQTTVRNVVEAYFLCMVSIIPIASTCMCTLLPA